MEAQDLDRHTLAALRAAALRDRVVSVVHALNTEELYELVQVDYLARRLGEVEPVQGPGDGTPSLSASGPPSVMLSDEEWVETIKEASARASEPGASIPAEKAIQRVRAMSA